MKPDNTRLLEKIQALLNKAGDSGVTEAESQSFFAKAMELLAKNGLETSDLDAVKKDANGKADFEIQQSEKSMGRKLHEADDYIWPILNRCFGVKTLYTTEWGTGNHAWLFVGDALQIQLAEIAAKVIYRTMTHNVRRYIKANGLKKTASVKRSYFIGVQHGYLEKVKEAEAAAYAEATAGQRDAYGLVLVGKKEAIERFTEEVIKPVTKKTTNVKVDADAFYSGKETGRSMDLNSANKLG